MEQMNSRDMRKALKEAGMYEEGMSREDIENYYAALTNSKDSAKTENKSREWQGCSSNLGSATCTLTEDSPKKPKCEEKKLFLSNEKNLSQCSDLSTEEEKNEGLDATKAFVAFHDMPKFEKIDVEIIEHPMKYVNIQNSPEFQSASIKEKALMLYSYHTAMAKLRSDLYRKSLYFAPLSRPIQIEVEGTSDDLEGNTYTSRSGRPIKKRCYNEDEDSLDAFESKKAKNGDLQSTPAKKFVSDDIFEFSENSDIKLTTSVPLHSSPKSTRKTNSLEIAKSGISKSKTQDPLKPLETNYLSQSSLDVEEMSIPSFKSIETDFARYKRSTRGEKIMEKSFQNTRKQETSQKILEDFEKSLMGSDDELCSQKEDEKETICIPDEKPVPRRVIPRMPSFKRGGANSKTKRIQNSKNESSVSNRRSTNTSIQTSFSKDDFESNGHDLDLTKVTESNKVPCPLCGVNFSRTLIAQHAASCGEQDTVPRYTRGSQKTMSLNDSCTLTCNFCDKVVLTNYDQHVNECRKSFKK